MESPFPIEGFHEIQEDARRLLWRDAHNIERGLYPASVLTPENPLTHVTRFRKIVGDGFKIERRRRKRNAHEFSEASKVYFDEVPEYFRRNFHFQTDGYLSPHSANLYEHQVEMLFSGTADAMRRLVIPPIKAHHGAPLKILELASGTGRSSRFVKLAFPKARLTITDLSAPYLKYAQAQMKNFDKVDFLQADATQLSFKDEQYDVVFSVFLHHELPQTQREASFSEMKRVLKPGGIAVIVDSVQKGEVPFMDKELLKFPQEFHEPFYANYIQRPIEQSLAQLGFSKIGQDRGFTSKVVWAIKP